ncbi:glycosyltransferase 87 family protein [Thermoleophilum album]|uniref:DUF2029 domain-containing protein n=1 Tax=Thermoleophilum album TaxID=29539 RepID=A0A1H6FN41_THEAL|nr:glycosyltransferase 87 family protein [Thermoleophilum album]SEH11610.1 Protein of unknown function [Thermoleophilum album]
MRRREWAAWAAFALAVWIPTMFAWPWWAGGLHSDVPTLRRYGLALASGSLPYRDFPFEYPPLGALALALPALGGSGSFRTLFGLQQLAALAVTAWALTRVVASHTRGVTAAFTIAGLPLLLGTVAWVHFDLVAVACTALAAERLLAGRWRACGLLLGAGALVKLFPLAALAPACAYLWARTGRRAAIELASCAALVVLGGAGVAALLSPPGALHVLLYHLERPLEIESVWALALAIGSLLGGDARVVFSHASVGIQGSGAGLLAGASSTITLLAVAATAAAAASAGRRGRNRDSAIFVLAAPLALVAFGKVLSPQFLVWGWPLIALCWARGRYALALIGAAAQLLTLVEFPHHFARLAALDPLVILLTLLRDLTLVAFFSGLLYARRERLAATVPSLRALAR